LETFKLKLNIGCGPGGQFEGYINIDNSPSILLGKFSAVKKILWTLRIIDKSKYIADWSGVIRCDVSKRINYSNDTVDKIYTSHLLEHLPRDKGVFFIKECYRILKHGGVMRLVVPDLLFHAEKYVEITKALISKEELPNDRNTHDTFLNTIYGAYLKKRRYGAEHYYMYDLPTLVSILKDSGFENIKKCEYKEGADKELASFDSRPDESLHLECIK
jgi:predicted SAM-dependent methyltransferase